MTQLISMQLAAWKTTQKFDVRPSSHSEANLLLIHLNVTMTSSLLSILKNPHLIYVEKEKKERVNSFNYGLCILHYATRNLPFNYMLDWMGKPTL